MRLTKIARLRLRSLFSRNKVEQELGEELRYHLDRQIEAEIAAGKTPEEARHAALRAIRDVEQRKEDCRDIWGLVWLEDLKSDFRYAFRQFHKHKSFYAVAAVILALGIGANTAIFSAVDGVLLRPFPYRQSDRLVSVWCMEPAQGIPKMGCALPDLRAIAARNRSFKALAEYYSGDINLTSGTPERVSGVYASANLFHLLGAHPALGRTFSPSEEVFGRNRVVVLSDALWRERFRGMPGAIGKIVHLNDEAYTVIGVMPPDFHFPNPGAMLWLPMSFAPNDSMATRGNDFISAIARRRAGVSIAQAKADVRSIARRLQREFSQNAGVGAGVSNYLSSVVGDVRPVLLILLGAVGIVLLIACVNVANPLLSKASGRKREHSVRAALGATRARLLRQLLTEGVLLGGAGACLGIALSVWLVRVIRVIGPDRIPRLQSIGIDPPVLLFAVAVSFLSVLVFGLAPAMSLTRGRIGEMLKEGGRSSTAGSRTGRFRDGLVIAEIGLSLVLLIGAGLLLQTLWRLQHTSPGFQPANVLTMSVTLPQAKYPWNEPGKTVHFFAELTKRLRRVHGVAAVSASTAMPITGWGGWGKYFTVEERPASRLSDVPVIQYRQVMPQFVKALGISVVKGRFFTPDDTGTRPLVAVIDESARRRFFPNENPIGKRVSPTASDSILAKLLHRPGVHAPRFTIVGVIGDVKQAGLSQPAQPALFVSYLQTTVKDTEAPGNKMFLFIKVHSDPLGYAAVARRIVQSIDPEQPVADVATMDQRLKTSLSMQRFQLDLFGAFALLALILAAVGIYGVLSYSVRLRMHEIGIRMALGASASDVLRMVIIHGFRLGIYGVIAGSILALGVTRLMTSLLFGVSAEDGVTFAMASLLLMAVVAAASFLPSLRAARTDALTVLRME
ncbi:MAG TPA: ABC transporter permease [Bryobacteraceae bacterium]